MRLTLSLLAAIAGAAMGGASSSPRVIRVIATDYAFSGPDTVSAGPVEFALENRGKVRHEVVLRALRPGVGASQIVEAVQSNAPDIGSIMADATSFGVLFATPGQTSQARLLVNLERGRRYALLCFFRDSVNAPRHMAMGMFRVLHVK